MDNQVAERSPARESRLARSDRKSRRASEGSDKILKLMKVAIFLMMAAIFALGAILLFRWAKVQNEPPKSFYDLQLRKWQATVEKDPTNALAHVNLGYVFYQQGNDRAARGEFNTALQYDEKNPMAYYYLGMIDKRSDNADSALDNLTMSFKMANGTNKLLPAIELGGIFEKKKEYKKAAMYYEAAVSTGGMYWNANFGLARVYEKLGKKSKALAQYKEAAKFNPDNGVLKSAIKRLSK